MTTNARRPGMLARLGLRPGRRRASATTYLEVANVTGAQAVWTPVQFDRLIREGYEHAVWVYACVQAQTRIIRQTRWLLKSGDKELETHPLLTLMRRPNAEQASASFLEALFGYWLTAGNTYVEAVRAGPTSPPVELWIKRPDRIRVLADTDNRIRGYEYTVAGRSYDFDLTQMRHLKTWAPLNDWYGMSPIAAAARGVDLFNAGQSHNLALIQNGARPSGAWIAAGKLNDKEFERFKREIREHTAINERGTPILLEGGVEWRETGISPKDLDWLNGQTDAGRQIHAAYGVHPVLTGLEQGTYENQRLAQRGLLINAVLPFLDLFVEELNAWLVPSFGTNLDLYYDREAFPALAEDETALWDRSTKGWSSDLLTRDEARAMIGYGALGAGRGDVFRSEALMARLATNASAGEERSQVTAEIVTRSALPNTTRTTRTLTPPSDLTAYWADRVTLQLDWEERTRDWFAGRFRNERALLAERLETAPDDAAIMAAIDTTVTPDTFTDYQDLFLDMMAAGGISALEAHGWSTGGTTSATGAGPEHRRVDLGLLLELFGPYFQQAFDRARAHISKVVGEISLTTKDALAALVADGVSAGLSIPDIAKTIDGLYLEQIIPNRSVVIARTETIAATNSGSQTAAKATGLNLTKRWLSTPDDRTRDAHVAANGQAVPIDSPYNVGDEAIMYPGDPDGSAENIIQCRCTETYEEL